MQRLVMEESYCKICQVPLTGPSSAQQHYEGQKHKKKEEALKAASDLGFEFNKICSVPHAKQDMPKLHQDLHPCQQLPTNSQVQFTFQNRIPDIIPVSCKLTQNTSNTDICKTETSHLQHSGADERSTDSTDCQEQKYYDMFNGIRGCCHLCKIDFTSIKHAKQHLNGLKHLKAVRVAEGQKKFYGNSPSVLPQPQLTECTNIGKSSLSGKSAAGMSFHHQHHDHHLPSSSLCSFSQSEHSRKVYDTNTNSGFQKACSQNSSGIYPERQFPLFDDHSISLSLNLKEDSLNPCFLSNEDPFKGNLKPKPTPENSLLVNYPSCTKDQNFLNLSISHEKNHEYPKKPTAENPLPYTCPVCSKKLNSSDQLTLHINSHQGKASPGDAVRTGVDNTVWLPCPYCGKPLNSVKSLRAHFENAHKMTSKEIDDYFDGIGTKSLEKPIQQSNMLLGSNHVDDKYDRHNISDFLSESLLSRKQEVYNDLNSRSNGISGDQRFDLNICSRGMHHDFKEVQLVKSLGSGMQQMPKAAEICVGMVDLSINKQDVILKGCGKQSCLFHCCVCNICLNSFKQRDDHKIGSQHIKKLHGTSLALVDAKYHCELCNASMNTQTDYERHIKGQQHTLNATRKVPAPVRDFGPEFNNEDSDTYNNDFSNLTVSKPRSYQVELYQKAMKTDAVCFLPTGTGKTLVSIMVMSHMLRKYPGRPVVFLVDKVLLVLQQCNEIKKEIGDKPFKRWNGSKGQLEERKLRIAKLCRGKQELNENEVWQQDVIVITAAYYYNLLKSESLRWTDNCLVIFDEAHHCVKKHPYKQILEAVSQRNKEHTQLPKILGLTASPAGRSTVKETLSMLRQLLLEFGKNAELITVEGTNEMKELISFQSNTELLVREMIHSTQETIFIDTLRRYILECWLRLKQNMLLKSGEELEAQFGLLGNITEKNIGEYLQYLNSDTASVLADGIDITCDASKEDGNKRVEKFFLQSHIKYFCQLLGTLETLGMECTIKDLDYDYCQQKNSFADFNTAAELHLPCEKLQELINDYVINKPSEGVATHADTSDQKEETGEDSFLPIVDELVKLIVNRKDYCSVSEDKPLSLILVTRRNNAMQLTEMLAEAKLLSERDMKVICITGHGSGKDGMNVSQQEKILTEIQEHKYQVIVATSVAEEGLDLPLCDLVVQLNPPDTVRALVQIRGRARKKGSQFVAFCQTAEQKTSFEELLKHEEHMIAAVKQLVAESNNL